MNQSSDEDATVDQNNDILNQHISSASLVNLEPRQLPSMSSLDGVKIPDFDKIKLGNPNPTTSTSSIDPISSGVSTSTAAKHAKDHLLSKAKRMKKSQALIQSKIVTQNSSVQQSVQQPLLNLSLGRAAENMNQSGHHGGTQQLQQNSSASMAINETNVKHQKIIKNHRTLQKRMISLQSERLSTSEVASTKAAAQILKHGSGSHQSKTALMVISSSGVHISKPTAANNQVDEENSFIYNGNNKKSQESTFDNRISTGISQNEGMDKHSSMVAFQSPVKPSHKLQTAAPRKINSPSDNNKQSNFPNSMPSQISPKEQVSSQSIKATLKPLILQKTGGTSSGIVQQPGSAMPIKTTLNRSKQSTELDQGSAHGSMNGTNNH